ncbi:MAG: FAD-dependent oxidoreductase [Solirubrobacteraceae bacterium]
MAASDDTQTLPGAGRRAAIVGAGPAGFYTADQLLAQGFEVDLYDELPTPFGLVRSGVAPDHPKIKAVTRVYEKTARKDGFRFFGGVRLGEHITRQDLLDRYDVVVYAFGTADDNRLGIPGEDRPGSHPATRFVAWYNGHPNAADEQFDLSCERAVVIGNGNVAIDVARMLVLDPEELSPTDTADHALEAFAASRITEVELLGRRGPAQAAFTNPELRELGELRRADVAVEHHDMELDPGSERWLTEEGDATARRNVDILREYAQRGHKDLSHRITLRFLRSPIEIVGEGEDGPVTGVRVAVNRIEADEQGRLRAVPTGEEELIECGLVLRSIGYRGRPVDTIPFDAARGLIRNEGGRVIGDDGAPARGEYAVGWIKRGPSGVIGTNKKDAADTVAKIVADAGAYNTPSQPDADAIAEWIVQRAPDVVTWEGWQAIDAHERGLGEPDGRPRVKLVRVADLVATGRSTPAG